jgi:4-amino-4-deoxy-L-arabinose transferase-like glycosyltransferase
MFSQKIQPRDMFLPVCLITLLALFLRGAYIENTVIVNPITRDAREYIRYGYNLAYQGVFSQDTDSQPPHPDSFRSPGYPMLIALSFLIGGEERFYPLLIYSQAVFSTLLVPMTFLLALRMLSIWAAFAAACFTAISPHLIAITSYALTETLFGFLLLWAVLTFCYGIEKKQIYRMLLSGILFGLTYLTNETALFLPIGVGLAPVLLFYLHEKSVNKKLFLSIAAFWLAFSLFPVGWTLRNHLNLPADALKGSSRALATLSHGTYPDFVYKSEHFKYVPYKEDPMQPAFGSSMENFITIFKERFQERPWRYIRWYLFEKPYYLWSWNLLQGNDVYVYKVSSSLYTTSSLANLKREVMKFLHPMILILSLAGIPLCFLRVRQCPEEMAVPLCIMLVLVYYTFLYMVFASWPRYSIPLRPELYLWAAWSVNALINLMPCAPGSHQPSIDQ